MIKPYPIKNSAALARYFGEDTASMVWSGKVADFLQIKGRSVTKPDLSKAASGYSPLDGRPLYQRHSFHRRLGWDIVFMPPKSISVAALLGSHGSRIIRAHFQAVESAFNLLAEPAAAVKTRSPAHLHEWQITGKMLFTHCIHRTNREKEPHLHSHVLLMNTTLSPSNTLMALESGAFFERLGAMERVYNHELCRHLRREGIDATMSGSGKAIISDLEKSESIHRAFSKAHARVLKHASSIAGQIQEQRSKDRLYPLHPNRLAFLSRQIANDRYRPKKEPGIEKKITCSHWRRTIDLASLELIDQASKSKKGIRLRTLRNESTQSVILPSIVSDLSAREFPHRSKRNITTIQVMIRCTRDTPDLSAGEILAAALTHSGKISDRSRREDMEAHIKAGLALTGLRVLNTLQPTERIKVGDPVLSKALLERVPPATRRVRIAHSVDKFIDTRNQRTPTVHSPTLNQALTENFHTIRSTYGHRQ